MEAGKLRHIVIIERYTSTADSVGQMVKTWTTHETRRAGVMNQEMSEGVNQGQKVMPKAMTTFVFRLPLDITERDRLKHKNKIYNITSVINVDDRDRELHITATWTGETYE